MTGFWAFITVGGDPTYICFSKDQNFWWASANATTQQWDDLKDGATHGRPWNAELWQVAAITTPNWDQLLAFFATPQKGAWGSQFPPHMPWTLLDNFSVP
jgi:hypothetical protein